MAQSMANEASELIKTPQLAEELGLSPRTLANLRSQGKGPRFKKLGPGRFAPVRYARCDVDAWLNQSSAEAA